MALSARLPLAVDRYGACVRTVLIRGLDLTGVTMAAEVRLRPDTPGDALIALGMGANASAEGLYLVSAAAGDDGVMVSTVQIRINETTLEGLPYAGEVGDASTFAWDWQATIGGDKRRLAYGDFVVLPGVTGADNAAADRAVSYAPRTIASTWRTAQLTFGPETVAITIDGADITSALVARAEAAAAEVASTVVQNDDEPPADELVAGWYGENSAGFYAAGLFHGGVRTTHAELWKAKITNNGSEWSPDDATGDISTVDESGFARVSSGNGATGDTLRLEAAMGLLHGRADRTAPIPQPRGVTVLAHRAITAGGNAAQTDRTQYLVPENSIAGLELAARYGFEWVETDLYLTSDRKVRMFHDEDMRTIARLRDGYALIPADPPTYIHSLTDATIESDYVLASNYPALRLPPPRLTDYLIACRDFGLKPALELKNPPSDTDYTFGAGDIAAVVDEAIKYLGVGNFSIDSWSWDVVDAARTYNADITLGYQFTGSVPTSTQLDHIAAQAPAFLMLTAADVGAQILADCASRGIELMVAPPFTIEDWPTFMALGVKSVCSDAAAPAQHGQRVIWSYYSGIDWIDATMPAGALADGVVTLAEGETLTIAPPDWAGVLFGSLALSVELDGAATIATTNINAAVTTSGYERLTYPVQLLGRLVQSITITGGEGSCTVRGLNASIACHDS